MQELTSEAIDTYRLISPGKISQVPTPRSPNALKLLLGQYAAALFENEATYYPDGPDLPHWLKKLGERVASTVLDKVTQVEHAGRFRYVSLSYHNVRLPEMQRAIGAALELEVSRRFAAAVKEQVKQGLAKIHQDAVDSIEQHPAQPGKKQKDIAETRKAFIEPMLTERGWSILDWANEAEVAYHTAADYLSGATNPFRSSRAKLAKALSVSPNTLPE